MSLSDRRSRSDGFTPLELQLPETVPGLYTLAAMEQATLIYTLTNTYDYYRARLEAASLLATTKTLRLPLDRLSSSTRRQSQERRRLCIATNTGVHTAHEVGQKCNRPELGSRWSNEPQQILHCQYRNQPKLKGHMRNDLKHPSQSAIGR